MLQLQRKPSSQSVRGAAQTATAASVSLGLQDDWTEKHRPLSLTAMKIHHTKLRALRQWFALVRDGAQLGKCTTVHRYRSLIARRLSL